MKKIILIFISLSLIIFTTYFLMYNKHKHNKGLESSLNSAIKTEIDATRRGHTANININDLTNFDWDEAHIVSPYTNQEKLNEQLGMEFRDPSNMKSRDDIYLMVFILNREVIEYVEIDRVDGEITANNNDSDILTPDNPKLNITLYK
ncbi:hypothetical protein IC619_006625 [Hazenella sp. IB182353]|uniref:hypothetical protein n=1 Tax=Polycladospora coralii TaxID=2771432 RepID=UPI0017476B94|nr:hypothetical protein [Polycladospora coralii]MBS7530170.1 hypothetical protein [Polycladospora coralii]